MAHLHDIIDNDLMFAINEHTRIVSCVGIHNPVLVQFDHNSERITFEMPRYIEGHDMSICNKVEVHYLNASAAEKVAGVYVVDDLQISPATDSTVRFTWLVSRNATGIAGSLNFVIRFACITGDVIDYAWNTAIYSGISVSAGMNNGEATEEEYHDVLAGFESRIARLESAVLWLDAPEIEVEGAEQEEEEKHGYTLTIDCNSYGSETVLEINGVTQSNIVGTWENVETVKIYSSNGDGIYFTVSQGTFPDYSGAEVTLVDDVVIADIWK